MAAAALALAPGCAGPRSASARAASPGIALISDLHIDADPNRVARGINMTNNLRAVLDEILAWPQLPGTLFANGDLAFNSGLTGDYAAVLRLLAPVRAAGMPIHAGLGNHDDRHKFWTLLAMDKTEPRQLPGRQAAVISTETANWFVLDSLIQTLTTPGRLGEAQRRWLTAALDAHPDKPAIIMVHHQPQTVPETDPKIGLQDTPELLAIVRPRRQVKACFCGHTHRWSVSQDESGIHMVNLPPTAYVFTAGQPSGWVHATMGDHGMLLEFRALDRAHPVHGQVYNLDWRAA
jgi:3',5'-cyclic AMP phosphodiesterase CpdA